MTDTNVTAQNESSYPLSDEDKIENAFWSLAMQDEFRQDGLKFEYRVVEIEGDSYVVDYEYIDHHDGFGRVPHVTVAPINELGAEGWELVQVLPLEEKLIGYFKRSYINKAN